MDSQRIEQKTNAIRRFIVREVGCNAIFCFLRYGQFHNENEAALLLLSREFVNRVTSTGTSGSKLASLLTCFKLADTSMTYCYTFGNNTI